MRRWLLLLCLLSPAAARADSAGEANIRFLWGRELYGQVRYQQALDQFLVSNRLSPNPAPALGIARCFGVLDRPVEAYNAYAEYLDHPLPEAEAARGRAEQGELHSRVARLLVETEPAGATIYLDRKNLGALGPAPRTVAAGPGEHQLIVELPGRRTVEQRVSLVKGEILAVRLVLPPLTGRVQVRTQPPGAEIKDSAEGAALGLSPAELELPLGARQLHLRLEGYQPAQATVLVEEAPPAVVEVTLSALPPPQGRLRVETNVVAALVLVNGEAAGFSPVVLNLREGRYAVSMQKPGYQAVSAEVAVRRDHTSAVEGTLQPLDAAPGPGPVPWIMLAATAAAGASAAVLGAQALSASAAYDDSPSPSRAQYQRVGRLNAATDVLLGVTLAGAAATAGAFLLGEGNTLPPSSSKVSEGGEQAR